MCGIAGTATEKSDLLDEDGVHAAVALLRHRGPDAAGVCCFRGVRSAAIGAVRLRILDLSEQADQPMGDEDGNVWVAYNGELYNFIELRQELKAAGHRFRTTTDTECLVHLYRHVGGDAPQMLDRLRGMFAFAIWDVRRQRLVLARDRLGIKPLAWAYKAGTLSFASEVRALAHSGLSGTTPDPDAVRGYLAWGSVPRPAALVAGVRHLGPGEFIAWDGGAPTPQTWWRPRFRADPTLSEPEAAVPALRRALHDSVERHLVAERPTGLFLSSGTDSQAVARIAVAHQPVQALTVTFPEADDLDEGGQAGELAAALGIRHVSVPMTAQGLGPLLPDVLAGMDQPTVDGVNSWVVCRAAREAGYVVALSGMGGDELFGGYPSFRSAPRVNRLTAALATLPAGARRGLAAGAARRAPGGRVGKVLGAPAGLGGAYGAVRRLFSDADLTAFGLPESPALPPASLPTDGGDAVSSLELGCYLAWQLLPDTDSVSMAHSLEVRVPLLDDEVVRVALAIPSGVRLAPGKSLLAAAAGITTIPEKRGFTMPFDQWLRGPLRSIVEDAVCSDAMPFADLLDGSRRRALWSAFLAGRVHWSRPWALAVLRLWPAANGFTW